MLWRNMIANVLRGLVTRRRRRRCSFYPATKLSYRMPQDKKNALNRKKINDKIRIKKGIQDLLKTYLVYSTGLLSLKNT